MPQADGTGEGISPGKTERKRQRERKRRSDLAEAFDELSALLSQFEASAEQASSSSDCAASVTGRGDPFNSKRRKRRSSFGGEESDEGTGMTRLDLIARTMGALQRLQQENLDLRRQLGEQNNTQESEVLIMVPTLSPNDRVHNTETQPPHPYHAYASYTSQPHPPRPPQQSPPAPPPFYGTNYYEYGDSGRDPANWQNHQSSHPSLTHHTHPQHPNYLGPPGYASSMMMTQYYHPPPVPDVPHSPSQHYHHQPPQHFSAPNNGRIAPPQQLDHPHPTGSMDPQHHPRQEE